jgi:hypothetical protein
LLVYGTLANEPFTLDSRLLMVGQKAIEGFWLSEWIPRQGVLTMLGLFRRIRKLFGSGVFNTEIAATFPPEQIKAAVEQAASPARGGKVLLKFTS